MLTLLHGTDGDAARRALATLIKAEKATALYITDAHSLEDMQAALRGPGMFAAGKRVVIFDGIFTSGSQDHRSQLTDAVRYLSDAKEPFVILEGKLDAATRKLLEKHASHAEEFVAPKKQEEKTIFVLANALQRGDKKALWVGLMREYAKGSAPEAVLGLLFWGAKQMVLKSRSDAEAERGKRLVAALAELPHKARRRGEDLSYALERFALSAL